MIPPSDAATWAVRMIDWMLSLGEIILITQTGEVIVGMEVVE